MTFCWRLCESAYIGPFWLPACPPDPAKPVIQRLKEVCWSMVDGMWRVKPLCTTILCETLWYAQMLDISWYQDIRALGWLKEVWIRPLSDLRRGNMGTVLVCCPDTTGLSHWLQAFKSTGTTCVHRSLSAFSHWADFSSLENPPKGDSCLHVLANLLHVWTESRNCLGCSEFKRWFGMSW